MAAQLFTVRQALTSCGVDDVDLFERQTKAERLASELFDDQFASCMDKTFEELDEDLKVYSSLTVNQGQIRLTPGVKKNIKAFIQWCRDMIRTNRDPSSEAFPNHDTTALIRRYKSHEAYISKSKTITENAKPVRLKTTIKWEDWKPVFVNFLRSIPGRDGVPLSYVIRDNENSTLVNNGDLLDMYVAGAPLNGEAYRVDANEVHTYIVSFIAGNETAEAKILPHQIECDGRKDFLALCEHYEGVGIHAIDITKADQIIDALYYQGEKRPYMWWEEFEKQLSMAFVVYDRREGRQVYSDEMKLRILCRKVNADFLQHIRASIDIEINKPTVTMTYQQALANFRNEVNRRFPPDVSSKNNRTSRRISQVNGRGGRGRSGGRGRGRGAPGGRGNQNNNKRNRHDARFIVDTQGKRMEVHPAYQFSSDEWSRIPREVQQQLISERQAYKNSRQRTGTNPSDNRSTISEITTDQRSINQTGTNSGGGATTVTFDNSGGGTIMGGRNEATQLRSRNNTQQS